MMLKARIISLLAAVFFAFPAGVLSSPDSQLLLTTFSDGYAGNNFQPAEPQEKPIPGVPPPAPEPQEPAVSGDFSFAPPYSFGGLNELTVKLLDAARTSIDVSIYSVTMQDTVQALVRARDRGVKVRLIIDESHVYPKMDGQIKGLIDGGGIDIRTLRGTGTWGVNHNKIVVLDRSAVTTGSYNWTFGATFSNCENMLVARQPVYVAGYAAYFEWMWSRARSLKDGPMPQLEQGYYGPPPQDPGSIAVLNGVSVPAFLFSPGSKTEDRLASLIDAAKVSLDAVTFTFSSQALVDAVLRAHQRGLKVRFMMDINMARDSGFARQLADAGVPFRWRGGLTEKGAMHSKYAVLDGQILATGSFNWTSNASVNSFENLLFTGEGGVIKAYQSDYDLLYSGASVVLPGDIRPAAASGG